MFRISGPPERMYSDVCENPNTICRIGDLPKNQTKTEKNIFIPNGDIAFRLHAASEMKQQNVLHSLTGFDPLSSCQSIKSFGSLSSFSSLSKCRSLCLSTHTAVRVTILLIDIQGFTFQCASLPAGYVGQWVAAFYSRVDKVAAAHGVQKVAVRGDCCICVAGLEGAVPFPVTKVQQAPDLKSDQATRMLAFAEELHSSLATLPSGAEKGKLCDSYTATRMGVATGEATFLANAAAGLEGAPCASVWGEVVEIAALLDSKAAPGKVYVHRSTSGRRRLASCRRRRRWWSASGGRWSGRRCTIVPPDPSRPRRPQPPTGYGARGARCGRSPARASEPTRELET